MRRISRLGTCLAFLWFVTTHVARCLDIFLATQIATFHSGMVAKSTNADFPGLRTTPDCEEPESIYNDNLHPFSVKWVGECFQGCFT